MTPVAAVRPVPDPESFEAAFVVPRADRIWLHSQPAILPSEPGSGPVRA